MKSLLTLALATTVAAQPAGHLVTSLPGLSEMPSFRVFAGYINYTSLASPNLKSTFYWLFESQNSPETDELRIFAQGGPGCSGGFSVFELGPFRLGANTSAGWNMQYNPLSWNLNANLLVWDAPIGVGFSYSSNPADYNNLNDISTAQDEYAFLNAFLEAYPSYKGRQLTLSGESYAGNYGTFLGAALATKAYGPAPDLKFTHLALGNPVISCELDNGNNVPFPNIAGAIQADQFYYHGLLPRSFYDQYKKAGCDSFYPPYNPCNDMTQTMWTLVGGDVDPSDLYSGPCGNATLGVYTGSQSQCVNSGGLWTQYLNSPQVWQAIHAQPPIYGKWMVCAPINYTLTWTSNTPLYKDIVNAGVNVLIYSGDVDIATCPFSSTQLCLDLLSETDVIPWTEWKILGQTAGYFRKTDTYTYATVKAAGHEAPLFQPLESLTMLTRFITNGTLFATKEEAEAAELAFSVGKRLASNDETKKAKPRYGGRIYADGRVGDL